MFVPLPQGFVDLLRPNRNTNLSLAFDKGAESLAWRGDHKKKQEFFRSFADRFNSTGNDEPLKAFLARRDMVLQSLKARVVPLSTATRLVVGLGLAHPAETGFLLDRLTGCPYLPGSSVKGLLRAGAVLTSQAEFAVGGEGLSEAPAQYWMEARRRDVFGPEAAAEGGPAQGTVVFYDAFPTGRPTLEVDVLTPHYGEYYMSARALPGDWYDPVPVLFLAVAPGVIYRFAFGARRGALDGELAAQLEALLVVALDWVGIGGKKSAGYGFFSPSAPETQRQVRQGSQPVSAPAADRRASRQGPASVRVSGEIVPDAAAQAILARVRSMAPSRVRAEIDAIGKRWQDLTGEARRQVAEAVLDLLERAGVLKDKKWREARSWVEEMQRSHQKADDT